MNIGKDVYNVIEINENNLSIEEIKQSVNYQWATIILKYFEKVGSNA